MLGATLESLNRFIKSCVTESDAGQETCISSLPWMLPWPGAAFAAATRSADEARVRNRAWHLGSETGGLDYLSRRSSGWIPRDTMSWRTVAQMAGREEPALRPAAVWDTMRRDSSVLFFLRRYPHHQPGVQRHTIACDT